MTIPRSRVALAVGGLVVLGAIGVSLVPAAAMPATVPTAPVDDATAVSNADGALLEALAVTGDPTSSGTTVGAQSLSLRDRIANVRGHLVHATVTVLDRDGALATYQLDHGTVSAVGGTSITIAEAGGSSVTVATSSETRVRKAAWPSTLADVKVGDQVVARSEVAAGSATATLVLVVPAASTTTPSSGGNG